MKRARVLVSGKVQGVCFRDVCRRMAAEHGVLGWVRNLRDGRVEAVFEGSDDAVDRMVAWAYHGPGTARVTDVDVQAETPEGLTRFEVR
ncbi:MAG TPA: acylphosphatase [Micromonosporaceae bacterium]|nr:acylphosphatase [Micromonosporaceae bacterium]